MRRCSLTVRAKLPDHGVSNKCGLFSPTLGFALGQTDVTRSDALFKELLFKGAPIE